MDAIISKLVEQGPFAIMAAALLLLFYYKDKTLTDSKNEHLVDVKDMTTQMLRATLSATESVNKLTELIEKILEIQIERARAFDDMARMIGDLQRVQGEMMVHLRTQRTLESAR